MKSRRHTALFAAITLQLGLLYACAGDQQQGDEYGQQGQEDYDDEGNQEGGDNYGNQEGGDNYENGNPNAQQGNGNYSNTGNNVTENDASNFSNNGTESGNNYGGNALENSYQNTQGEGEGINNSVQDDYAVEDANTEQPMVDQAAPPPMEEPMAEPTPSYVPTGEVPEGWARLQNGLFIPLSALSDTPVGYLEQTPMWQ